MSKGVRLRRLRKTPGNTSQYPPPGCIVCGKPETDQSLLSLGRLSPGDPVTARTEPLSWTDR